jgi:hypothetical protein
LHGSLKHSAELALRKAKTLDFFHIVQYKSLESLKLFGVTETNELQTVVSPDQTTAKHLYS